MRLKRVNSNEAAPSSSIVPPAYVDPKTGARQRPDSPTIGDSPIRVELALDRLVPPGFDLAMDRLVEVGHRAGAHPVVPHGASVMSSTRRTDTPAAVDECGWPLARSPAKLPPVRSGARNGDSRSSARVAAVQLVTKWYRIGSC